jgi:hypothetical protein
MGKFERSKYILLACMSILTADSTLILFPLISGICTLLVSLSFLPFIDPVVWKDLASHHHHHQLQQTTGPVTAHELWEYCKMFAFYFCNYFIITFFNTGLTACAMRHMRGEVTGFRDGIYEAYIRLPQILSWSVICAIFATVMRIVESRSQSIAVIFAAALSGIAFSVASYFVIPVMIAENKGPIDALKQAGTLFRKTWGEQLISGLGFGVVMVVMLIPAVLLFAIGCYMASKVLMVTFMGLALVWFLACVLVQSALEVIFRTALYNYAVGGTVAEEFETDDMKLAFVKGGKKSTGRI